MDQLARIGDRRRQELKVLQARCVREGMRKLVKDTGSVGDHGEQPIKVVLIDALRKGDDTEKRSGVTHVRTKFSEHGGGAKVRP